MAQTNRTLITYPSEGEVNWWGKFKSMIDSIDQMLFSARSHRNLALVHQDDIEFGVDYVVTWPEMKLFHGAKGFIGTIAAGSLLLADGAGLYVNIPHPPSKNYSLVPQILAGNVPNSDSAQLLFYRNGERLWIMGGQLVLTGQTSAGGASGGVTEGDVLRQVIPLVTAGYQGEGLAVLGRVRLDPATNYTFAEAQGQTYEIHIEANVLVDGQTAFVKLYDTTGAPVELASFDFNSDQPAKFSSAFTLQAAGERAYELQAGLDPLGAPYGLGESVVIWNAALHIVTTF